MNHELHDGYGLESGQIATRKGAKQRAEVNEKKNVSFRTVMESLTLLRKNERCARKPKKNTSNRGAKDRRDSWARRVKREYRSGGKVKCVLQERTCEGYNPGIKRRPRCLKKESQNFKEARDLEKKSFALKGV